MGKRIWVSLGFIIILLLVPAAVLGMELMKKKITAGMKYSGEAFRNPMMGYAPSADYYEAALPEDLVYIDITWAEWEPEEGEFAWAQVMTDNYVQEWKDMGKHAVLRFVCDIPSKESHMDIPEWLYEKTGDGVFYDISYGLGYCPDYSNPIFLEEHAKALKKLGEYAAKDGFIAFVELGSLGHWGEWHTKESDGLPAIPEERICEKYVQQYAEAFPDKKLLMRRNYKIGIEKGFGVFNDMAGLSEDTLEWLDWQKNGGSYHDNLVYQPVEEIWNTAPVGGEFTSAISMEEMLGNALAETLGLISASHMTFLGPKCPILGEDGAEGADEVLKTLGYRYWVKKLTLRETQEGLKISLVFRNDGTAPMYYDWPVMLYVTDDTGAEYAAGILDLRLPQLLSGQEQEVEAVVPWKDGMLDDIRIGIGILDPDSGKPAVRLTMEEKFVNGINFIYENYDAEQAAGGK